MQLLIRLSLNETDMQPNEWHNKTVGMSTDGPSVMIGIRNGVVTKIKADVPHLISVHWVAHRLELGIKDSIKDVAYLAKVEDFLLSIYKFYSNSPLNWQNLKETGTALNIKVLKSANVKGTRWIPHHAQAAKAIKQDWPCLLAHLDSVSINGQSADAKAKATGFVRLLRSFEFVYFLHFFLDLCQILARMSLKFQANDTSVENVTTCVATTLSGVRGLVTTPRSHEAVFLREVEDGTVKKGQELVGDRDSAIQNVSRNKQAILDAIDAHLQGRFSSFENEDIFKNMSIFNFKNWPLGLKELQVYGNEQLSSVKSLLTSQKAHQAGAYLRFQ